MVAAEVLLQAQVRHVRREDGHWKGDVHVNGQRFSCDTRYGSWGVEDGESYKHVHPDIAVMLQECRKKIERKERRGQGVDSTHQA